MPKCSGCGYESKNKQEFWDENTCWSCHYNPRRSGLYFFGVPPIDEAPNEDERGGEG